MENKTDTIEHNIPKNNKFEKLLFKKKKKNDNYAGPDFYLLNRVNI